MILPNQRAQHRPVLPRSLHIVGRRLKGLLHGGAEHERMVKMPGKSLGYGIDDRGAGGNDSGHPQTQQGRHLRLCGAAVEKNEPEHLLLGQHGRHAARLRAARSQKQLLAVRMARVVKEPELVAVLRQVFPEPVQRRVRFPVQVKMPLLHRAGMQQGIDCVILVREALQGMDRVIGKRQEKYRLAHIILDGWRAQGYRL